MRAHGDRGRTLRDLPQRHRDTEVWDVPIERKISVSRCLCGLYFSVSSAPSAMHSDPAIRFLRELVAVNSVNPTLVPGAPGERDVAALIAAEMRKSRLDVSVEAVADGRPNVVGVLEGRAPGRTLMFCGHTDTVGVAGMRDPFTPIERDGRLYARGAQDMKGGVAAMIDAAASIARNGGLAAGRLVVAAVVDEEHSSIGADALVKKWHADAAIVTEPTDLAIAIGHKGFAWVEVNVEG